MPLLRDLGGIWGCSKTKRLWPRKVLAVNVMGPVQWLAEDIGSLHGFFGVSLGI